MRLGIDPVPLSSRWIDALDWAFRLRHGACSTQATELPTVAVDEQCFHLRRRARVSLWHGLAVPVQHRDAGLMLAARCSKLEDRGRMLRQVVAMS